MKKIKWRYRIGYAACALCISASVYYDMHEVTNEASVTQVSEANPNAKVKTENIRFINMEEHVTNFQQRKNTLDITTKNDTYVLNPDTIHVEQKEIGTPAVFYYESNQTKHVYKIRLNNTLFHALKKQYEQQTMKTWQPVVTYK